MGNPTFESVTPLIPAGPDLQSALDLYQRMGFSIEWHDGNGAGVKRGSVCFNLVRNDNREWASNASFSVAVSDLQSLHEEFAIFGQTSARWSLSLGDGLSFT
ncbi:MAG: hypothetical protein JO024_03240 [Candidatus Eremiobacteraeota bacterium]|nr:hypothetical protein [Candidatus Eremiobacteraeota bacterium]